MNDITVQLHFKPGSESVFCKARPVPCAIRPKAEADLDALVENGVFELETPASGPRLLFRSRRKEVESGAVGTSMWGNFKFICWS